MRLRVIIRGRVQGVGFRPFVYRLATGLGLAGWVNNSSQGVVVEVEGTASELDRFLSRIQSEAPPLSSIQSLEPLWLDPVGFQGFEIRESSNSAEHSAIVLPDIAVCEDCLRDVLDPSNRRFRYPFTNCTHCGPRFSILEALPYDRANTSMKNFAMCAECRAEYKDPTNRRFHAQPNACQKCGPHLELWEGGDGRQPSGTPRVCANGDNALKATARAIAEGDIVAVKGLGGFHLMCLASDDVVVRKLRERKHREEKPFAVMFPALAGIREECSISTLERRLLESPESPIVLVRRKSRVANQKSRIAKSVAPCNPWLGVMLPYTPMHHLLMHELGVPVVATSGNLSDEPICTDNREVSKRLAGVADWFLMHNRPIVRHVDDSIVQVVAGREMVLRRARGYAPLPPSPQSEIRSPKSENVLAVGAHLKNSVALSVGPQVFVSQHIGDLETETAFEAFQKVIGDLQQIYGVSAARIVADAHPDYLSTGFARQSGLPLLQVQHHVAHVLSCMAENELTAPVLGVAWDGTGFGLDGTVWGGEFIRIRRSQDGLMWNRAAHLRRFRLPGGDLAVKEPRRSALGILHELQQDAPVGPEESLVTKAFGAGELKTLRHMLERGLNSPWTSSAGRLFDAVASLSGLRQLVRHEGQAAMALEFAAEDVNTAEAYACPIGDGLAAETAPPRTAAPPPSLPGTKDSTDTLDWGPLIRGIVQDVREGVAVGLISARFHNGLAEAIVAVAKRVGFEQVTLTGGCFQNRRLLERTIRGLQKAGFRPYWHQRVPPNDGGIALGQVFAANWNLRQHPSEYSPDCARD